MPNPTPEGRAGVTNRGEAWKRQRDREDRAARQAAIAFFVAILASLALVVVYALGGQTQLEGTLLFVAFAGVGVGLGVWVKVIIGPETLVEDRPLMSAGPDQRETFVQDYEASLGKAISGGRRRFLIRLLMGVAASLGLALLIPIGSLGPGPANELFTTSWRNGRRLVDLEGSPIRPEDVVADQVVTVFPADHVGEADAQTVLIGLRPDTPVDLEYETVEGLVAYSKICTHAGCPVGLYRARVGELLCPCHQSTFGVYRGAIPLSGPAGRPLPQLPLGVDDEGYLVALSGYREPVGPTFWNVTRDPVDDTADAGTSGGEG